MYKEFWIKVPQFDGTSEITLKDISKTDHSTEPQKKKKQGRKSVNDSWELIH